MTTPGFGQLGLALCATLAVSACEMKAGRTTDPATATAGAADPAGADAAGSAVTLVERDVEAPGVFQVSDKGLWDGRPSLGGVWVAHASVKEPERVMIRNPATGKFVVGALFKREFESTGPALQVSSDAADALGMLAGQPQVLNVVALKREELPEGGVPADPDRALAGGSPVVGDKVNDDAAAPAAGAPSAAEIGAALGTPAKAGDARAGSAKAGDTKAGTEKAGGTAAESGAPAVSPAEATVPELAAQPEPRRKRWWPFGKRKADAAAPAPAAEGAATAPVAATLAPGVIAAAPLDATAPAATAPAATAPAAGPAKPAATLKRAYVQIGIFSQEANAETAARQMKSAGMTATVRPDQSGGKPFWRVIVGPAATEAERSALAQRVKGLGYPDAYPVSK